MSTEITNGQVNGDLELEAERNNGKRPRFFKSLLKEKNSKNGSTRASKKSESNNVGQNSVSAFLSQFRLKTNRLVSRQKTSTTTMSLTLEPSEVGDQAQE
jgi:hypothetical protein